MGRASFKASVSVPGGAGGFGHAARALPNIVQREFSDSLGPRLLRITRYAAPRKSGALERGLGFRVKGAGASGAELRIESSVRSSTGFPYTRATRFGRRAIVPIRAKALRFTAGGRTIFARRVRAYTPSRDWGYTAYLAGRPEMERSSFRIGRRVQAFIGH